MKLRQILPADAQIAARDADIDVRGVTADSRAVKPGDVFVAVAGSKTDGLHFIGPAVAAGAVAVLAERSPEARSSLPRSISGLKDSSPVFVGFCREAAIHYSPGLQPWVAPTRNAP